MTNWPQNVGNRISEDFIFKIFRGGCPRTPLQGTAFGGPKNEPPYVKSWIRPCKVFTRYAQKRDSDWFMRPLTMVKVWEQNLLSRGGRGESVSMHWSAALTKKRYIPHYKNRVSERVPSGSSQYSFHWHSRVKRETSQTAICYRLPTAAP